MKLFLVLIAIPDFFGQWMFVLFVPLVLTQTGLELKSAHSVPQDLMRQKHLFTHNLRPIQNYLGWKHIVRVIALLLAGVFLVITLTVELLMAILSM